LPLRIHADDRHAARGGAPAAIDASATAEYVLAGSGEGRLKMSVGQASTPAAGLQTRSRTAGVDAGRRTGVLPHEEAAMPVAELEREQITGSEMTPAMARGARVRKETYAPFTLALDPPDGEPFPGFTPGQFSMLYVFGNGELPISISGDPEDRARLLYTVRSVGKTTQALVS